MAIVREVRSEQINEPGVKPTEYNGKTYYVQTTHEGLVLGLREANGYHDSDFYATVWDPIEKKPKEIEYATTRGWTYLNSASIDATPEVKKAYKEYLEADRLRRKAEYEAELAKMPKIGQRFRVLKGRKLPVGTIGEIFWVGKDKMREQRRSWYSTGWECLLPFRYYADEYRLGIRLLDGTKVFISAANGEVTDAA